MDGDVCQTPCKAFYIHYFVLATQKYHKERDISFLHTRCLSFRGRKNHFPKIIQLENGGAGFTQCLAHTGI